MTLSILRSDALILNFEYLATTYIRPLSEVDRNSSISNTSRHPLTDRTLALSPPLKMSISTTATSPLQTTTTKAENPSLGTLSILPREIRDEIYRHLLKSHFYLYHTSLRPRSRSPHLSLLSVSKATYNEASSILYSESVFQLHSAYIPTWYLPEPTVRRMKKIEIVFDSWNYWSKWFASELNELNIGRHPRDSLAIISRHGGMEWSETLLGLVSEELDAFKAFRTVSLIVNLKTGPWYDDEEQNLITRVIK